MSELAAERTNNQTILDLADRIDISQEDEIDFMENWLESRGENKNLSGHKHMPKQEHMKMVGMASSEELKELRESKSTSFDKLFLKLMINHHDGALEMVKTLKEFPGNSYDSSLDEFISELINDQGVEIERMNGILVNLSDDPRSNLEPGLYDAGQSIQNLKLVTSLKKPIGFFDPENPEGKGTKRIEKDSKKDEKVRTIEEMSSSLRWPILSFASTDMAFRDNILVAGSYHGFNIYEIQTDGIPNLISSVVCPGGQGDVSIVGHLLILSVEQTRGRVDCGRDGVSEKVSEERFRGLRIFDLSDITRPRQVGQVQTCRGSHTHSVVSGPDEDGMIVVYNSGTSVVREEEELAGCIGNIAGDQRTALFRIDVIEIPIDSPGDARIVDSPGVFADEETGVLAGLWLSLIHI